MSIFDGLPDPREAGMAFHAGMQRARADREEQEARGALSAYAMNPDDPASFEGLARWRPDLAIQLRGDRDKREQDAAAADLQRRAAGGDRAALAELASIDLDAYDKLADNDRATMKERVDAIGNAALDIANRPEAERAAAWDAYIDQLSTRYPELAEYKGHYSEELLRSAIADAGKMQDFLKSGMPDYQVIPEGGTLVNTRDPGAVQSFVGGGDIPTVASPEEARRLPPGSQFRTPDGRTMRVPGGGGGNAPGGFPAAR